ncbi:MAG: peptidase and DD-carboxypeptidase VanY/endolysin [Herbinix sp.]|nr:peptidase and DD-carboxypeptidase VanY/endolysin [Herbinix sp.]
MNKLLEICNDTNKLNGLVKAMLELALADIKKQGVNPLVIETYRPQDRQNYLYCQGRTIAECTAKGIKSSFAKTYCNPSANIITKTLNSVHTSRKAVDIVPQRIVNKKMTAIWNVKDPQTQIIIKTMQKYGFEAGANWDTFVDSPHFQVKGDFTIQFDNKHNTPYVTGVIQKALNLKVDKSWGKTTTAAVNKFRKSMGYKTALGQIGADAYRALMTKSI